MEYTLKTKGETDEFESVITISGLTSDVTIHSLLDHLESTQKTAKEAHMTMQVNDMFISEAEKKMPLLAEIPEEHRALASQYFFKLEANRQSQNLLDTCQNTIETYTTHLKAVEEATGIKCLPEVAPFQLVDLDTSDKDA